MNFRDVYYDWSAVIANLISVNNRDLNKITSEKGGDHIDQRTPPR